MTSKGQCPTINWDEVREKTAKYDWAKAIVKQCKLDFDEHVELHPGNPPTGESGWGHYYFCDECGNSLIFDLTKPNEHICSHCHKVFSGSPYDNTWINTFHGRNTNILKNAAILAHLPDADPKYAEFIRRTIMFYVDNYDLYENSSTHCGKGKIQPDNLTEAWFILAIEGVLRMVADLDIFDDEDLEYIGERFFRPEAELIKPQIRSIHNIHITMVASLAACANFLGDREMLEEAIHGKLGFYDQINRGVRKDGLWFEISDSYHSLTLNSLLAIAFTARENGINLFQDPIFKKMGTVYGRLAYKDGLIPAYNDGWYGHRIYEYDYQFEQLAYAYDTCGDNYYSRLLNYCYELKEKQGVETPTGFPRCSREALLYGPIELEEGKVLSNSSDVLEDTGIAILRKGDLRVNLKANKYGGGHDHNDKLSIEVYSKGEYISTDPGTSGYSLPLTGRWSRTSLAHNLVCIDEIRQKNSDGEIISFSHNRATARAKNSYDNAKLERTIELTEKGYRDIFKVACTDTSTIDWVFHCVGQLDCSLEMEPVTIEPMAAHNIKTKKIPESSYDTRFVENGYDQLMDMRRAEIQDDFTLSYRTDRQIVRFSFKGEPGTELYLGKCYATSYVDIQNIIILRRNTTSTTFDVVVTFQDI